MEIDWRIAEFIVQLGVAGGTLGLAWFALHEMKQNRKAREMEIFERYAEKYNDIKSDAWRALGKVSEKENNWPAAIFNQDNAEKDFLNLLKLFEREYFLKSEGWISKEFWAIWKKGHQKYLYALAEVCFFKDKNILGKENFRDRYGNLVLSEFFLDYYQREYETIIKRGPKNA